jgi:hypothetical protein
MGIWDAAFIFLRTWFVSKSNLADENLALRQQLAVVNQSIKRPKLCLLRFNQFGLSKFKS